MRRLVLPLVTALLLAAVVADRMSRVVSSSLSASSSPAIEPDSAPAPARARRPAPVPVPAANGATIVAATPTLDRLARLAVRQQLARATGLTYLDSLVATTDSVVRRWPDRGGQPLRVAIVEGGAAGYAPRMAELLRQALGRWAGAGVGLGFVEVSDTGTADIVVRWIDRFEYDRAGQTDLTWDQSGRVRRANVSLALHSVGGATLSDPALLSVAVHETGHAIGLPHSADSNDVMFPSTRTAALSERDIRTAQLLYQLPPGQIRDSAGQ